MASSPPSSTGRRLILVRYSGDISTKSPKTKQRFTRRLAQNVKNGLATTGSPYQIRRDWHRLIVETDSPLALDILPRVFGVQSVSLAVRRTWSSLDALVREGEAHFAPAVRGRRFAVRARRAGDARRIPFRAAELDRALGTALLAHAASVDLRTPEVTARVEIYPEEAYLFTEMIPGEAGLPIGVQGRAVALVSGGFDSAVAAWMMLRRGVSLDYLFCNLGGADHRRGVLHVMKTISDLWSFGDRPHLYEIDFQPVVEAIQGKTYAKYWQLLLKRAMLRAADRLAAELGAEALVTGDSVGQVSSQTLQNMAVISGATARPVLRPLVGSNKDEILALARRIGTYERSAQVVEYCGILPKHPSTRASREAVEGEEARLEPDLLGAAFKRRVVYELRRLDPRILFPSGLEVEAIPDRAVVLDLRSRSAYDAWHHPDALHLEFAEALRAYPAFPRDRAYALYCEVGFKSAHLAETMREAGFTVCHVRRGVRTLILRPRAGVSAAE